MNGVSDYLYAKAAQNKIPLSGTFELSPVCNFACRMCYVRKTHEQIRAEGKALRPWQDWLELGRQCAKEGMLYLLLTGGEPFLYPGFRELYESLHKLGLVLSINSNGTLIDEDAVAWLKRFAPQRVSITLYGASRETYAKVCGQPSGFDRAMKAIRMLHEAGIPVVINASMIPENEADLEAITAIGKELGLNTRVANYMFPPARRDAELSDSRFTPEKAAEVFLRKVRCFYDEERYDQYLRSQAQKPEKTAEDWGSDGEFMRCRAGRSSFWVAWDGTMTACGLMQFPLVVHPFREPFRDCWLHLTDRVRSTAVLKECAGCPRRERCMPCAAMLQVEVGDVNKKAPYLCEMAEHVERLVKEEAERRGKETEIN